MKAVQEIFHVSMTPAEFAEISTVSELAAFICSQPQENTAQKPVVQVTCTEDVACAFDVERIRQDFPAMSQTIHGHPLVYLDNAATMQMPMQVMEAVREVELLRGNVHRGIHTLSSRCTDAYEQARAVCAQFFGTEPGYHLYLRHHRWHQPGGGSVYGQTGGNCGHGIGAPLEFCPVAAAVQKNRAGISNLSHPAWMER